MEVVLITCQLELVCACSAAMPVSACRLAQSVLDLRAPEQAAAGFLPVGEQAYDLRREQRPLQILPDHQRGLPLRRLQVISHPTAELAGWAQGRGRALTGLSLSQQWAGSGAERGPLCRPSNKRAPNEKAKDNKPTLNE